MAKKKAPVVQIVNKRGQMLAVRPGNDARQALRDHYDETLRDYGFHHSRVTGTAEQAKLTCKNGSQNREYTGTVCS